MNRWLHFLIGAIAVIASPLVQSATDDSTISLDSIPALTQESQHAAASKRLSIIYKRDHYRPIALNDELSSKAFERYLEMLDYNRHFFSKQDINRFEKYRYQLDESLKSGRLSAMYEIYNLNQKRRFEQYSYAITLLEKPFDFDKAETYQVDRSEAEWAADRTALNEIWRKRVKYDALNLKLAGKEWPKIAELLKKRYSTAIKRLTQTNSEDVFQAAMNAYAYSVEPHTSYLSPRNEDRFQMEMNLSLEGIGAVLQAKDEYTVIQSLVAGGPAAESEELKPEDKIIGVAQADGEMVDIIGMRLDDVVELIKGPKGTEVRLEILPAKVTEGGKTKIVTIIRDKIRLENRAAKSEVIEMENKKIGVITIPGFYIQLSNDVEKELNELKKQDVEGIVIDLRDNGGGSLDAVISMTGLFIGDGPVVQVRHSSGSIDVKAKKSNVVYDGPLAVLVNRYSASASEIFAAAMQDYGRALIIGEQTFGKGTVQGVYGLSKVFDLYDNKIGSVHFTIAQFYRINGGSTQHKGVIPDIAFPTAIPAEETGESLEKNALPWDMIKPANYKPVGSMSGLLKQLDQDHLAHVANDPEFQYILSDIEEYRKERGKKEVTLREADRLKKRKEQEAKELSRINDRLKRLGKPEVKSLEDIPEDFDYADPYLDEAARLTLKLALLTDQCDSKTASC